jgi:flavodoxin
MDAILVVCYSHTGTSRRAAELLSSHHGWPLGEITDPAPRTSLRCAIDSLLRRRPRIRYEGPEPAAFRTVVLVAPIWMYRLAAPMRSFIAQRREALPRIAMIATMNSGGATNAFGEAARLLGRAPIATAAFLQREIDDGSGIARLLAFGDALQPGSTATQPTRGGARTAAA